MKRDWEKAHGPYVDDISWAKGTIIEGEATFLKGFLRTRTFPAQKCTPCPRSDRVGILLSQ